ncbi:MAG: hypothetical protein NTX42_00685 [Methanothrix sp.]|nr:hypothetical protein [Methanothrix sp.]
MIQIPTFLRFHWLKVLVTYVLVPSFINAIYSLKPIILMWTFLIELCLLVIAIIAMALYSKRNHSSHSRNEAFQVPRKGMVFTVGKQLETIRFAIKNQNPKFIGLICSAETEVQANKLKDWWKDELGNDEEHFMKKEVDPKNIEDIRAMTVSILNWLKSKGLQDSEITVDITGGMTTMSAGVFDVSEEQKIDSQYIFSKYDPVNNRVIMDTKDAILFSQHSKG